MIAGIDNIKKIMSKVFKEFDILDDIEIRYSNIEGIDIQCNNLIRYSKIKNLTKIKEAIESELLNNPYIEKIDINDKNFINLTFSNAYLLDHSSSAEKRIKEVKDESVIFDYGGPNIGKDLHVGHIRTLNIGRSLYNIYKRAGYKVISDIHFGDWGKPIGLILAYLEEKEISLDTLTYSDLEVIYPRANNLSQENESFNDKAKEISKQLNSENKIYIQKWKHIHNLAIPNIKKLLNKLDHKFDWYFGESDAIKEVSTVVNEAISKGLLIEDSGALISTEEADPPILVTKSDGSYLYLTTDLGTVYFREQQQKFNKYVYVVDSRQKNHFEQLFKTVKYFDLSNAMFVHVGFGTVNGPGNKPFKTRDGGVYKLDTLYEDIKKKLKKYNDDEKILNTLTNTVLTYSDLLPNRNQNYVFDLDKFTDINGKTGIYIQYAQVRAKKLLGKSDSIKNKNYISRFNNEERQLRLLITKFTYYFNLSKNNYEPHHLADYLYTLCQSFNSFYAKNKIFSDNISDEKKAIRIQIVKDFYNTSCLVSDCLGIKLVDSM
jgi:arginyl-tRNA synthetase